ncbi:MAG: hypothetical protein JWQ87_3424 [Candidatus Sulfotelmatobacter sp.]|nr:hypothetical protein [Candidatus Sulfotelmatobacter sp.]
MAALAATTLLVPGTVLDRVWALNPTAHKQLSLVGGKVTLLFLPLAVALVASGIGWFRRRLWGWKLAVGIVAVQVIGDSINFVKGDWIRGGIGVIIAGSLLLYLLRSPVKSAFY